MRKERRGSKDVGERWGYRRGGKMELDNRREERRGSKDTEKK